MLAASPLIESGKVLIPAEAAWLADFQTEVVNFPKGKHDDQVDSMSQFLNWVKSHVSQADVLAVLELNKYFPRMLSSYYDGP